MNDFYRVSWFKGNDSLWTWLRNVLKEILMLSKNLHPCPQSALCSNMCRAAGWGVFLPIKLLFHVFVEKILFITLTNRSFNTGDIFICEWVHRNHSSKCIWKDQPLGLFVFTADGLLVKKNVLFSKRKKHWLFPKISNFVR